MATAAKGNEMRRAQMFAMNKTAEITEMTAKSFNAGI